MTELSQNKIEWLLICDGLVSEFAEKHSGIIFEFSDEIIQIRNKHKTYKQREYYLMNLFHDIDIVLCALSVIEAL